VGISLAAEPGDSRSGIEGPWARPDYRQLLPILLALLLAGCPPDVSPHMALALPSGQLVPVYTLEVIAIHNAGTERRALRIQYETSLPIGDEKVLKQEAMTEIFPMVAPRAERQLLSAVAAAIDSVEHLTGTGERVLQIRRDESGVVVTVAADDAGPMDRETDVRVRTDGSIWSVEPLH
jgi:hypothetical protein